MRAVGQVYALGMVVKLGRLMPADKAKKMGS